MPKTIGIVEVACVAAQSRNIPANRHKNRYVTVHKVRRQCR